MSRVTIGVEEAADLYSDGEGEHGDVVGEWTLVGRAQDHKHRQSRWHQRYWLIVRNADGETYGLDYGLGLTEDQENDLPWVGGITPEHPLTLTRLYEHTVTRTEYRTTA